MATKREHAVAILDALDSKARLTSRTLVGSGIAAIFLLLIAYFTMWQYAAGGALLIALLLQMTHERLTVAADAMIASNLEKLGWKFDALNDEASMTKLRDMAKRNEG
tara:strand:+ start:512 stop:832 length:321 start_codon:yes stop_codon:yes gene_type:complete